MYFFLITLSALLFSFQFAMNSGFQKEEGAGWSSSLRFSFYSSLAGALLDRGMRLLLLTPLSRGQEPPLSDPEAYAALLSGVSARLAARGLTLGQGFSCVQAKTRLPLCWAAFWLTAACSGRHRRDKDTAS